MNNMTVTATETVRWLGVSLDSNLTFKHHVDTCVATKVTKITGHFWRLCNSQRGVPVGLAVKAIKARAIPVLTYGGRRLVARSKPANKQRHKNVSSTPKASSTKSRRRSKRPQKRPSAAWRTAQTAALYRGVSKYHSVVRLSPRTRHKHRYRTP